MTDTIINREHKDRLFTILFGRSENKAWALDLYNAMNGSHYDNLDDIEVTTMEDTLYMGMKNDASFILNEYMNVYEQQSTYNPNMPIRQLMYSGRLYDKYIKTHHLSIYGKRVLPIPIPKLVVFYNGIDKDIEDEQYLYLADCFSNQEKGKEADITVRVKMVNINHGHNKGLLESCKPLAEYSKLIDMIRYNQKELKLEMGDAVDKAIDDMPRESVIYSFLDGHRSEVKMSCLTEYDEAATMEYLKNEAREEGREEGREEALRTLVKKKIAKGKPLETIADELEVSVDEIRDLYDELCPEDLVK